MNKLCCIINPSAKCNVCSMAICDPCFIKLTGKDKHKYTWHEEYCDCVIGPLEGQGLVFNRR